MSVTRCCRSPRGALTISGQSGFLCMLRNWCDPLSQCDVMKLRTHPGTTILFCAIKENPRRKNCCVCE
ncbi:hypothetical protein FSB65_15420 [Paraburkholderia sp. JPY418]|uniref:Uncharacterized protein n=1 Tax=Paraburkholderia youngii TaxID=2782701 RepID=A0ABX2NRR6_9BURK|nr:hypothetical protein [Paraburkholderia youngii]NVI07109.1 hypothetical protein [Paraburkholderia youngii]